MANVKVLHRNISSCFFANDAPLSQLVNLENSESSTECDFNIDILRDKKVSFEKQYSDNCSTKTSHQLSKDVSVTTNLAKTVNPNMSLGLLAKNHLENDRTLSEWYLGGDFNLTDVLMTDDLHLCVSKDEDSDINFDFLGTCHITKDNSESKFNKEQKSDDQIGNLSEFDYSCHALKFYPSDSISFDFSASHILNDCNNSSKNNFDENYYIPTITKLKSDESNIESVFDNILSKEKQGNIDVLTSNTKNTINGSSSSSSEVSEQKTQFEDDSSDGELLPDIDLSFCIKKNVSDEISSGASYLESVDSGFDETDLIPIKSTSVTYERNILDKVNCPFGKEKLTCSKQSLLSRAISAKSKMDDAKYNKLKKIKSELFKKQISSPVISSDQQDHTQMYNRIIDQSNEFILTSNFLTLTSNKSILS